MHETEIENRNPHLANVRVRVKKGELGESYRKFDLTHWFTTDTPLLHKEHTPTMGDQRRDVTYYAPQSREEQLWGRESTRSDEIIDKRLKVLRAYKTKQELKPLRRQQAQAIKKAASEIMPLSPIKVPRMKKFEWSCSPCIAGQEGPSVIPREQQWWKNEPAVCGSLMNASQSRLSLKENFTGSVKHNFRHHRVRAVSRGVKFTDTYNSDNAIGDFPEEAYKFLETSSSWKADHHLKVARQGDMLAEATFRASLRTDN